MENFILKHGDMTLEELQHWGIKGMKWGHRRFQNKDGSLTPAGEKRYYNDDGSLTKKGDKFYAKEKKRLEAQKVKVEAASARKAEVEKLKQDIEDMKSGKTTTSDKPKSAKEMSDDELRKAKARYDLERDYQKSYEQANPKQANKYEDLQPKNIAKDFISKSILPAAQEAGKSLIKDFMVANGKKILGLEKDPPPDSIEALKKIAERFKTEAEIQKHKKDIAVDKKTEYFNTRDYNAAVEKDNGGNDTQSNTKNKNQTENTNNQQKNSKNQKQNKNVDNSSSESKAAQNSKSDDDIPTWTGTVEGKGTSKAKSKTDEKKKKRSRQEDDIIDGYGEWVNESVSSVPATVRTKGQTIVTNLLEDRFFKHSDITFDDIEDLIHHGIKGQKWGVRRYQNQNGSLTPDGKKHRDEREGRNKYRVKDTAATSGGKGSTGKTDKELSLEELKKRDLENGYVDEKGIITKAGHAYEKKRRSKLTEEETIAELKEVHEYHLKGDNNSPEVDYKGGKILDELYKYVGYGYMGPGITSETKKAYANLESVNKRLHKKRPSELNESEQNELISAYDEVSSAMLKGLGYKDLPDARKYIQYLWDYD